MRGGWNPAATAVDLAARTVIGSEILDRVDRGLPLQWRAEAAAAEIARPRCRLLELIPQRGRGASASASAGEGSSRHHLVR